MTPTSADRSDTQDEVIAFLADPASHAAHPKHVEHVETHGAHVFLVGDDAYKIKRAVAFSYMDFSTLERRRHFVEREIEINRVHAPEIYLGVVAITRETNGRLAISGAGKPVEYAVHMRRFDQDRLSSHLARRNELSDTLAKQLADVVLEAHHRLEPLAESDADTRVARTLDSISGQLRSVGSTLQEDAVTRFDSLAIDQLVRARTCLRDRGTRGYVRRCHGDLHLNNIVLWNGVPTPFDAIEFNDDIAVIDTLYDLAFLLMDLDHVGQRRFGNLVLNRYLWRSRERADIEGLTALPLFLGLRSAVRAMTSAQRAGQEIQQAAERDTIAARSYLDDAIRYLAPPAPRLVAVGGISGTGKTTLAAEIAPLIDPAPGAVHIRTDLERKELFNVGELDRLPQHCYTAEASQQTYGIVLDKARDVLAAGHSVVVDAVFLRPDERAEIESVASSSGARFTGLWLTAPRDVLLARVAARTGDASDATPDVVELQIAADSPLSRWTSIDAGGTREATIAAARRHL